MKPTDFSTAIQICSFHHSTELVINQCAENGQVPSIESPTIHIKSCVPAVINKLIDKGFSLSMRNGLMSVDKI